MVEQSCVRIVVVQAMRRRIVGKSLDFLTGGQNATVKEIAVVAGETGDA